MKYPSQNWLKQIKTKGKIKLEWGNYVRNGCFLLAVSILNHQFASVGKLGGLCITDDG